MPEIISSTVVTAKGGVLHRVKHASTATKCDMIFAIFLPSTHKVSPALPALYFLSGLTCTDLNFSQKAGGNAFTKAEEEGIAIVLPDTSPRGDGIPNADGYDLGQGAGFYINATNEKWVDNFRMEDYVSQELPALVEAEWGVGANGLRSVTGHSMGGHGALTLALKKPEDWRSVSAFAPICHPSKPSPWGEKAFKAYFGSVEAGKDHDATEVIQKPGKAGVFDDILIDEGTDDEFRTGGQLLLEDFEEAAKKVGQKVTARRQKGFDHSYHFIAAFIADHVAFHAKRLRQAAGAAAAKKAKETAQSLATSGTAGKPIECKAMVARGAKQPLALETITVDPPRAGEVRVKVIANAVSSCDMDR